MRKSTFIGMLAGLVAAGGLSLAGWMPSADAADYHNPAVPGEQSAAYWLDRGGLLATYGNYPAAIRAYKKALELDPALSLSYYNLSLAYCENGDFDQAITAINRAMAMEPENAAFYYGRGWIMLQAQGVDKAQGDFQKAAALGNRDALNYLQGRGKKPPINR